MLGLHAVLLGFSPASSQTLTVYHVNPLHEGVLPIDMDTADLHGDMFFDLKSKTTPIERSSQFNGTRGGDCTNGEVVDTDLVISKLSIDVFGGFGEYGRCNICMEDGIDPFSGLKCTPGQYFCTCGNFRAPYACNDQRAVGREELSSAFGNFTICTWDVWVKAPWACWGWPVVRLTGGTWYSTTRAGWCDAPGADPATCTWRARVEKIVNKSCSDDIIYSAVEAYDAERDGCFARCPSHQRGQARNTSATCWIYCFYATVLGERTLVPGEHSDGMPLPELEAAFERPFLSEALGGCPSIPPPKSPVTQVPAHRSITRSWAQRRAAMIKRWYGEANSLRLPM
ncbi:hypothetical protein AB1Y20_018165 [Prymnesium parvum]|uniref:Uncharacterized protein n=1 Tax=Prymnesium parvum TaxID=97485 RepID=A0AB34JQ54_PRYPA